VLRLFECISRVFESISLGASLNYILIKENINAFFLFAAEDVHLVAGAHGSPVDDPPPLVHVLGALVLVVEIVGVLPHVDSLQTEVCV
jgi:hypothetical protein